jgi:hypothetical protein
MGARPYRWRLCDVAGSSVTDDDVIDAMRAHGKASVWVRWEGDEIKVITTNAADAMVLLERAVRALTTPVGETIQ